MRLFLQSDGLQLHTASLFLVEDKGREHKTHESAFGLCDLRYLQPALFDAFGNLHLQEPVCLLADAEMWERVCMRIPARLPVWSQAAEVLINHRDVEHQWWSQTSAGLPATQWGHQTTEGQASAVALWVGVGDVW